jgi:hypothetical protein
MGDHAQFPQAPAGSDPRAPKPMFLLRHRSVIFITTCSG